MEHQKSYVFSPAVSERPTKRRRTDQSNLHTSWPLREQAYEGYWADQEERIQGVLHRANVETVENIHNFLTTSKLNLGQEDTRLPINTGLVLAGPSIASHGPFFQQLSKHVMSHSASKVVLLSSGECPNLKTLLKVFIKKATARRDDGDEEELLVKSSKKGPKLMNFDLQLLYEWFQEHKPSQIVVTFQDSEGFDGTLLSEIIELFQSWSNRLPFALLFGVATSIESFQGKLPRSSLSRMSAKQFDVTQAQEVLDNVFWTSVNETTLRLGSGLSADLLERQKDHLQSVQAFSASLKYAYMSHFYANALSVFLHPELSFQDINADHFEALRNLPSFRSLIENALGNDEAEQARELLESDESLFKFVQEQVQVCNSALQNIVGACELLSTLRDCIPQLPKVSLPLLYVKAMSGQLASSPAVREFLLSFKKASSDMFLRIINLLIDKWGESNAPEAILTIRTEIEELLGSKEGDSAPLRSQHDIRNETLRTTVVAQKVELRAQKAALSKQDQKYSELLLRFHGQIESYFEGTLVDPESLFLHEILIYDIKSPQRAVFLPKTRYVIERALSIPHDYLACNCCPAGTKGKIDEGTLSATQPETAIVYQLYLESGALINVSDLWNAFFAIVGEGSEEAPVMARFQRALAELKYFGLIKPSRKKTDHIAKALWKGL